MNKMGFKGCILMLEKLRKFKLKKENRDKYICILLHYKMYLKLISKIT